MGKVGRWSRYTAKQWPPTVFSSASERDVYRVLARFLPLTNGLFLAPISLDFSAALACTHKHLCTIECIHFIASELRSKHDNRDCCLETNVRLQSAIPRNSPVSKKTLCRAARKSSLCAHMVVSLEMLTLEVSVYCYMKVIVLR